MNFDTKPDRNLKAIRADLVKARNEVENIADHMYSQGAASIVLATASYYARLIGEIDDIFYYRGMVAVSKQEANSGTEG